MWFVSGHFKFATILSVAAVQPAMAATLACHLDAPASLVREDDATIIDLNEAQHAVTVHFAAAHLSNPMGVTGGADGQGSSNPQATIGPVTATFGPDAISFSSPGGGEYVVDGNPYSAYAGSYFLNRLTGGFVHRKQGDGDALTVWQKWTCKAVTRQF